MATVVQLKRSAVPGKVPNVADLSVGELAINYADGLIYSKNTTDEIVVVASTTTSNIFEGTNLYFTNARSVGAFTAGDGINIDANGLLTVTVSGSGAVSSVNGLTGDVVLTTANVNESGNLYYTDERVYSNVVTAGFATESYVDGEVGSAFGQANAAYDQANIAIDYSTNAYNQANIATTNADGAFIQANTAATDSLSAFEQANVATTNADGAFTQANTAAVDSIAAFEQANAATTYSQAAFDQANIATTNASSAFDTANLKANITDLTTANVTELTNLYYTNARVLSYLATADVEVVGMTITGDLVVSGNTTTINATDLSITDAMLYLNQGTAAPITNIEGDGANVSFTANNNFSAGWDVSVYGVNPSSYNGLYTNILFANTTHFILADTNTDAYVSGGTARGKSNANPDIGFSAGYNDGQYHHTGLFRDATDGIWKFYQGYEPEPDESIFIDTSNASFQLANVQAHSFIGNISTLANHTTSNLTEGTNLYFTNARAVGALTSSDTVIVESNGYISANVVAGLAAGNQISIDGNGLITANVSSSSVTISNTAPASPSEGDLYWDEELGRLFIYYTDTDTSQWVDASSPGVGNTVNNIVLGKYISESFIANGTGSTFVVGNTIGSTAETFVFVDGVIQEPVINYNISDDVVTFTSPPDNGSNVFVRYTVGTDAYFGNFLPIANLTYNIGSPEFQWKELYLSGNTINLGGAQLKTNPTSGAIAIIPAPTEENPNPKATVVSATGTIATVDTIDGEINDDDVANVAANITSVFTDIEATGNITANIFIGDGGLLSNITGVTAETVTGVLTAGDQIVIDSNGLITANVTASAAAGNLIVIGRVTNTVVTPVSGSITITGRAANTDVSIT